MANSTYTEADYLEECEVLEEKASQVASDKFVAFVDQCAKSGLSARRCHETHWQIFLGDTRLVDFWPSAKKLRACNCKNKEKARRGDAADAIALAAAIVAGNRPNAKTSADKYGGPAFPCHTNPMPGKLANAPQGMTLRDYFAAAALERLATPVTACGGTVAAMCYAHADAMLAARETQIQTAEREVLAGLMRFVGELSRVVTGTATFVAQVEDGGGDGLQALMAEIEKRLNIKNEEVQS